MTTRTYVAIDLKSYFASVECVLRGLDPLKTNLVVADISRTEKTICLAVTPSLKAYGIPGRARLFEVNEKIKEIKKKTGQLIEFIIAPPQMARYVEYSSRIYNIYLKYVSADDIHVYSIDECFLDITEYLSMYKKTPRELVKEIIKEVFNSTKITATAGIGTNLYLCKIAMDIMAKHVEADSDGVRIAELDEKNYRKHLWSHRPLTDFWQIGKGTANRLEHCYLNDGRGILTMGDLARVSLKKQDSLYKIFGVNAEILIDHAWGYEPCSIKEIKKYKPKSNSISTSQVLSNPYGFEKAKIVIREMVDSLTLDLVEKDLVTNAVSIYIMYDKESVDNGIYQGETVVDFYGRIIPKPANGIARLASYTSSNTIISEQIMKFIDNIMNPTLTVRKIGISAMNLLKGTEKTYDLFTDIKKVEREKKMMQAQVSIKKRYGKNAIIKGMDLQEGATTIERNEQIGGHRA